MWSAGLRTALDRVPKRNRSSPTAQNGTGVLSSNSSNIQFLLHNACTVSYGFASHPIQSGAERAHSKFSRHRRPRPTPQLNLAPFPPGP